MNPTPFPSPLPPRARGPLLAALLLLGCAAPGLAGVTPSRPAAQDTPAEGDAARRRALASSLSLDDILALVPETRDRLLLQALQEHLEALAQHQELLRTVDQHGLGEGGTPAHPDEAEQAKLKRAWVKRQKDLRH